MQQHANVVLVAVSLWRPARMNYGPAPVSFGHHFRPRRSKASSFCKKSGHNFWELTWVIHVTESVADGVPNVMSEFKCGRGRVSADVRFSK